MRRTLYGFSTLYVLACLACQTAPAPVPTTHRLSPMGGALEVPLADPPPSAASEPEVTLSGAVRYTERREPCAERSRLRNVYFGDLHVHTGLSFDANTAGFYEGPEVAYAFARGAPVGLPPRDRQGRALQYARIERPLDFVAVTEHSEYLGEVLQCTTPGSSAYEGRACRRLRRGGFVAAGLLAYRGMQHAGTQDARHPRICPPGSDDCRRAARDAWRRIQDAAEVAYDRSSSCAFTSFVGFEWTGTHEASNLHRNILFRSARVPSVVTSALESTTPRALWDWLDASCQAELGCEVLSIPHNSNLSNGKMFSPVYPGVATFGERRELASQRARLEPLLEIFQHKGNSECYNGLSGVVGEPDELCEVEQLRRTRGAPRSRSARMIRRRMDLPKQIEECQGGDAARRGGVVGQGCVSRYDFARTALLGGLQQEVALGINPYRLGFVASTDTHVATPGAADEAGWQGHLGYETRLAERLVRSPYAGKLDANPGGLAGIWAVENSRDALFEAMLRRETFGTSGPRIVPRFFAGFDLPTNLCAQPELVERADAQGVPMGGTLEPPQKWAPLRLVVHAERDPSPSARGLSALQIVKGWLAQDGTPHYRVIGVAEHPKRLGVEEATCQPLGKGAATLCGTFEDREYDATLPTYYYARVVQAPTCRWSWAQCVRLAPSERPDACENDAPRTIHELAWTSPIWLASKVHRGSRHGRRQARPRDGFDP